MTTYHRKLNCKLMLSRNNFAGKELITDRDSDVSRRKFRCMLGLVRELISRTTAIIMQWLKAQIEANWTAFRSPWKFDQSNFPWWWNMSPLTIVSEILNEFCKLQIEIPSVRLSVRLITFFHDSKIIPWNKFYRAWFINTWIGLSLGIYSQIHFWYLC